MYEMYNILDDHIMTLEYRPEIGHVIRNDDTGRFYYVYEVDDDAKTCKAISTNDPRYN